jgi:hypothetical protein
MKFLSIAHGAIKQVMGTRSPLGIIKEGKMKKVIYGSLVLGFLVAQFGIAAQSRTTEFHKLKEKITSDKVMNITLPDGYFLSGIVKDALGVPLKNAYVDAANPDSGFGWGGATDATGMFSFPVQTGSYSVYATPPGSTSINPATFSRLLPLTVENISVANDMNMGEIKLQNGYIMSGKVNPPSGAIGMFTGTLVAFPSSGTYTTAFAAQFGSGLDSMKYAMAIPAGSYKLILIPIMVYSSTFQTIPMTFKTDKVTISKDTVKNITAPKGYKIWGTVKDSGKTGLNGALFVFQKSNPFVKNMSISAFTVIKGAYAGYLPKGNFTLVFVPYLSMNAGYKGKATKTSFDLVMRASDKMLNLVAQNGVVLSGKVTDARKKIVKSGGISMAKTGADASKKPGDWIWLIAVTNSKGQYRLPVPPDTYDIYAMPSSETTALRPTETLRQNLIKMMSTLRRLHLP